MNASLERIAFRRCGQKCVGQMLPFGPKRYPAGDPQQPLTRADLEQKARRLAAYASGASDDEMTTVIARIWRLSDEPHVRHLLTKP